MKQLGLAALLIGLASVPALCASYDDLNAGIQFTHQGDWQLAIARFDKALAANDLIPSLRYVAHLDRGRAHSALKHFDLAIADYSASLVLQPDDPEALVRRAVIYLNTGKYDKAAGDLDGLVGARPEMSAAYSLRAAINARRGMAEKSRQDIDTALSMLPRQSRGLGMGILAFQADRLDDAEENFEKAISRKTAPVYGWLWLSLSKLRQGKDVPARSLPDFDRQQWPATLIDFFLGKATQDAVFAAAADGEADLAKGQMCEANFYVAEWLLFHRDAAAAGPLLRKAADECPLAFVEWSPAQTELARLP